MKTISLNAYKLYFSVYEIVNNCLILQNGHCSYKELEGTAWSHTAMQQHLQKETGPVQKQVYAYLESLVIGNSYPTP